MSFDYGALEPRDLEFVSKLQAAAFAIDEQDVPAWLERAGHDAVRVLRADAVPIASLLLVPMAHRLHGRDVPCVGIAGVGVALHARGSGVARELMTRCVRELHGQGVALSSLFPATQALYRKVGYERAGKLVEFTVERDAFVGVPRARGVEARPLTRVDQPAIEELVDRAASSEDGVLVRGPYLWNRLWTRPKAPARAFGFFRGSKLIAHVFIVQEPDPDHAPMHAVRVLDYAFDCRDGALALLGFLHAQRSLATRYVLRGGPTLKLLHLLEEPRWEERAVLDWMVRITSVERALTARGWASSAHGELVLDVHDDLLDQRGRYALSVSDGKGRAHRIERHDGQASIELDVRALAPLVTGHLTARELLHLGLLEAPSLEAIGLVDELFRTGRPWVNEMF